MKMSELSCKQVVNMQDGAILGHIVDSELDGNFQIQLFTVAKPPRIVNKMLPWFFPCEELSFSVCDIINIGTDVILVKLK
ncbi:MAG: sporulation protein [Erysipelotrichaceae bacterium]|uniref:Sporulation protein n=1 Tax=Copranaerobaculum intestinale TaxID=2692629 RepID=A0A6N8U5M9_9FIRM|nr:sporulation protein [Copranaerobaculum intestinale]MBS6373227.1 sporulation protein [Erysipelotrichaceae bacterium]MXQ73508.1 sporulation protein [Copranaerobaculum intestinale]